MSNDYDSRLCIIGPKKSIAAIKIAADNRDDRSELFSEYIPYYSESWNSDTTNSSKINETTICWEIDFIGYGRFNVDKMFKSISSSYPDLVFRLDSAHEDFGNYIEGKSFPPTKKTLFEFTYTFIYFRGEAIDIHKGSDYWMDRYADIVSD